MNAMIVMVAVFFLGMGIFALARPAALIRPFGIALPNPESRAEVRAVYGGFGLAIAGMLALAASAVTVRDGILITVAAALGGMAFGRLVSGVVDRPKTFYPNWFYFVVEVVAAAALLWAARGQ
ncbi:MAG: DUF4345 domain-containing protein [Actinomycetota bacterium]|nr:DUF4345 domain-containing protein [Actinomycetota bacterium]MDA2948959.1 DUF4345 domain-containing protein [Actinomycetota bacterium]MDA2992199.1 DUF4345 domain-containing protein [Actinomycetota bacterium]